MNQVSVESARGWMALHCGSLDWKSAVAVFASLDEETRELVLASLDPGKKAWFLPYFERYQEFLRKNAITQ